MEEFPKSEESTNSEKLPIIKAPLKLEEHPLPEENKNVIDFNIILTIYEDMQRSTEFVRKIIDSHNKNLPLQAKKINNKIITNEELETFIHEKCIFDKKCSCKMSDLRDTYNELNRREVSLIAFSKKFNELSINYPVEKATQRINSQTGLWIKGIGIKP